MQWRPLKLAVSAKRLTASEESSSKPSRSQFLVYQTRMNKESGSCSVLPLIWHSKPICLHEMKAANLLAHVAIFNDNPQGSEQ
jgi:hypothetical protein